VFHQDFIRRPIRQEIHPSAARVQEKERNTKQKQQDAFPNFKERDQLEISMTTRFPQNCRNVRRIAHCLNCSPNPLIPQPASKE
jgi:hypothetical protein